MLCQGPAQVFGATVWPSANDVVVAAVQTRFEKHLEKLDATVDITLPPSRLARLKHETAQDKALQALAEVIKVGWPADKRDIALDVRAYHNVRDELTVENGIIFRGQRCVVPSSLRREVVEKLHTAHMGIDACLRRARECVYWPGLNGQIKDHVQACQTCQMYAQKQPRETFLSTEVPTRPWSVVAADLFSFAGREYMVLVDYYSNFIEVDVLPDTLSTTIIYLLKRQFARHGIPDKLRTDNGPPIFVCSIPEVCVRLALSTQHIESALSSIQRPCRKCSKNYQKYHEKGEGVGVATLGWACWLTVTHRRKT